MPSQHNKNSTQIQCLLLDFIVLQCILNSYNKHKYSTQYCKANTNQLPEYTGAFPMNSPEKLKYLILLKTESKSFFVSTRSCMCFRKSLCVVSQRVFDKPLKFNSISFVFSKRD